MTERREQDEHCCKRSTDPVPRHEIDNIKDYLIQVGNHELILTNMAYNFEEFTKAVGNNSKRMDKLETCSRELKTEIKETREVIEPVAEGLTSLNKVVKMLEPVTKIVGWTIGIAVAIGGTYAAVSSYLSHFKGHQ